MPVFEDENQEKHPQKQEKQALKVLKAFYFVLFEKQECQRKERIGHRKKDNIPKSEQSAKPTKSSFFRLLLPCQIDATQYASRTQQSNGCQRFAQEKQGTNGRKDRVQVNIIRSANGTQLLQNEVPHHEAHQ